MENRPKVLSCLTRGPGPVYRLPALVGYNEHDPSRYRNPSYTFRKRPGENYRTPGLGPCYRVEKLTKHGLDKAPAFTIGIPERPKKIEIIPGPGAYNPDICPLMNHSLRSPAYSIKFKNMEKFSTDGPGPNAYCLPTCLGPRVPDKTAQGAYTIISRHGTSDESPGPGPAGYPEGNYNLVRKKNPAYSVKLKQKTSNDTISPGPVYYPRFNTGKNQPKYSFGIRHSECSPPPITDADE